MLSTKLLFKVSLLVVFLYNEHDPIKLFDLTNNHNTSFRSRFLNSISDINL